uniref:Transposase (Putative), gypsy type n=1 Tax=Tanacetum cinerariifolium TaxID=118510 RepID=A0A6L2LI38_TANCI|nr:hypothetical protein [Tanacetum cinerariifolium]
MGTDTIRLEDVVSTISHEYLLEFTSEYDIPESLHPELPRPEEPIVEFPEGKVGVYTKFFEFANYHIDLFGLISAPNPTKVKTRTRPCAAHEVPLLTATASRVIDMEDTAVAGKAATTEVIPDPSLEKEVAAMGPLMNKRRHKRGKDEAKANVPPEVLRKDHAAFRPAQDPLSYAKPQPHPERDIAQSSRKTATVITSGYVATTEVHGLFFAESLESGKSTSFPSGDGSPGGDGFSTEAKIRKREVPGLRNQKRNLETLLEAEVSNLQAQVTGEEKIKAALEEFKRYDDDRVEQRFAEMDARLDKLSMDFDEEQYPYMLTAIAGRRWVIGHGLRLAVMKSAESPELRQAFADIVSAGLVKGMSEGLRHGIEHGRVGRDLAAIKEYDPEAESKYVKALQDQKDPRYPLEDAPQWIRDLRTSSSQLKIPIYPEVCDPKDPWAFKEDVLLEDTIAANRSRAEKKKKYRVVCRTHRVGSAHHAISDGVSVSVPTVAPRGLAIMLADAATQTKVADKEDEPSLRL